MRQPLPVESGTTDEAVADVPAGPVFVVGCARSGTSIVGELLASHPRVHYLFERHQVWERDGIGPDGSHRLTADAATPVRRAAIVEELTAGVPAGSVLVEKNPRHALRVPFLAEIFPDSRFVHVVRDGRDTACSLVPGCGGEEWRHLRPPDWRSLMAEHTGVERCARVWRDVVEIALADLASRPHLQLRYEDLVGDPVTTSRRLFAWIGLPYDAAALAFCERISDETSGSYHAATQAHWYRHDHARRVGRWCENLTAAEQEAVLPVVMPLLQRLGYAPDVSTAARRRDTATRSSDRRGSRS